MMLKEISQFPPVGFIYEIDGMGRSTASPGEKLSVHIKWEDTTFSYETSNVTFLPQNMEGACT